MGFCCCFALNEFACNDGTSQSFTENKNKIGVSPSFTLLCLVIELNVKTQKLMENGNGKKMYLNKERNKKCIQQCK